MTLDRTIVQSIAKS